MAKILIVEDDKFTRELYQSFLEEAGYQVDLAEDGVEGLAKALKGGYDLILLDIMLPKKDGISLLKDLKKTIPEKKNKKVVMLTVLDQKPFIQSALELGADGYLMKSALTPHEVLAEIEVFLGKNKKPSA